MGYHRLLSEVRRTGEEFIQLKNSHIFPTEDKKTKKETELVS